MLNRLIIYKIVLISFIINFFFSCTSNETTEEEPIPQKSNSNVNNLVSLIDNQEKEWMATNLKRTVETQLYWGKNSYLDTAITYTYLDSLNEERYKLIFLSDEPNMNITFTANDTLNKSIMIKPGSDSSQVNYLNKGKIIYSKNINLQDKGKLKFLSKEEEALFKRLRNSN